jgi:polyribonucleotide 5'-hydroxyl-kinase
MVIYVNTHAILDARRGAARAAAAKGGDLQASQVTALVSPCFVV